MKALDYMFKYVDSSLEEDFRNFLNQQGKDTESDIDFDTLEEYYQEVKKVCKKLVCNKDLQAIIDELKVVLKELGEEDFTGDFESDLNLVYSNIKQYIKKLEYFGLSKKTEAVDVLDHLADILNDDGYEYYAEWIWDIIAPFRQDNFKEYKKSNRKSLKESEDLANLIAEVKDVKNEVERREDDDFHDLADDLNAWLSEVNYNGLDRERASNLYDIADYYSKTNAEGITKVLFDICKRIIENLYYGHSYNESKKRKVIGKVSMREAKRALREGVDRKFEFEKKLSDTGFIFFSKGKKVIIPYDKDPSVFEKARKLADEVKTEFGGDYQIGMDNSGRATFTFIDEPIIYDDYEDVSKANKRLGKLSDYQKSVIEDIAQSDYEVGHPMSEDETLDWFSSGEEEDIPTDLALEAADYYFEAFDQIREDDNFDFEDEE